MHGGGRAGRAGAYERVDDLALLDEHDGDRCPHALPRRRRWASSRQSAAALSAAQEPHSFVAEARTYRSRRRDSVAMLPATQPRRRTFPHEQCAKAVLTHDRIECRIAAQVQLEMEVAGR